MIIWRVIGEYNDRDNAGKANYLAGGSVDYFFPTKAEAEAWAGEITCWVEGPKIAKLRVPANREKFCDFLNHFGASL